MPDTKKSRRPSAPLVISILALFVALGGSAYAAATVGTSDIQNGAVTTPKIADRAVTAPKIAHDAISTMHLRPTSVHHEDLAQIVVVTNSQSLAAGGVGGVSAVCPPGTDIVAGGHYNTGTAVYNLDSRRIASPGNGWFAFFKNNGAGSTTIYSEAYCMR